MRHETHIHYNEITASVLCGLIPNIFGTSFASIPNFGQAAIEMFYCLSIEKNQVAVLLPR